MSTELDIIHDGEIATTTPAPGTSAAAVDMLRGHAEMMDMAYELATKMVRTSMVPNIYRGKPEDATAAILYGAELGLNPIQSLQQVFAVHGQPAIYARTMVALLKSRGYRIWTVESTDESVTVAGVGPEGVDEESTWTIERADQAGYVAKKDSSGEWIKNSNGKIAGNTKYITDPQAMLYAKAAAEVCRKLAPDVLLGISHSREDLESEPDPEPVRATARRLDNRQAIGGGSGPVAVKQWPAEQPADEDQADAETASNGSAEQDTAPVTEAGRTKKADLDEAVALMDQIEGLESQEKRRTFVRTLFNDQKASAATLTREQRAYLLTELRGIIAQNEGRDSVAEASDNTAVERPEDKTEAGDQ